MPKANPSVVLGLWPIAGITSVGVTDQHSRATIRAALDQGITTFDTAFAYGYDGESDKLLAPFIRSGGEDLCVISKVGQRWNSDKKRIVDGRPESLIADAECSLQRMRLDHFDTLMLHCVDPEVPIEESAGAIEQLYRRGLCRKIGVCNVDADQRRRFRESAGACHAIQCPLNLLQPANLDQLIPDCLADGCEVYVFWALMKGLLAGQIGRDHQFAEGDSRPNYEIFQGQQRSRAHDVVDQLALIGKETGKTVAQLAIGWATAQPGVTAALVGAKRPVQIFETAAARPLDQQWVLKINEIVAASQPS